MLVGTALRNEPGDLDLGSGIGEVIFHPQGHSMSGLLMQCRKKQGVSYDTEDRRTALSLEEMKHRAGYGVPEHWWPT